MSDHKIDQEKLRALREIHGVIDVALDWSASETHYLEILSPDGVDGVYHIFALELDEGPWAAPEGTPRMQGVMDRLRSAAKLQVKDVWAEILWEPSGIPELHHRAVRRMEQDTAAWMVRAGIRPEVITAPELLNRLQDRLFKDLPSWYARRMALAAKLCLEPLPVVLKTFGHDVPEEDPPMFDYMSKLFPHKPGSWYIRIFDLNRLVMDRSAITDRLLSELSA